MAKLLEHPARRRLLELRQIRIAAYREQQRDRLTKLIVNLERIRRRLERLKK